jgi:N-acetylmuramoyl-L-alanine amidase
VNLSDELQARIDLANSAGADLLVSIHFNGTTDSAVKGTQIFYSDGRPFTDRNKMLADLTDAAIVKALADAGFTARDRKGTSDRTILGGDSHYYLLGPRSDIIKRPSQMPAIIGEALYLTNPDEASALRQDRILDALAKGYCDGIKAYFARFPVA